METIDNITKELREGVLTNDPHRCAEYVGVLSGELSFYLGQVSELEKNKPVEWLELRKGFKSDNACEKAWERTEVGVSISWYKVRIKRIIALLGGLKTLIKNCQTEQMNLH